MRLVTDVKSRRKQTTTKKHEKKTMKNKGKAYDVIDVIEKTKANIGH